MRKRSQPAQQKRGTNLSNIERLIYGMIVAMRKYRRLIKKHRRELILLGGAGVIVFVGLFALWAASLKLPAIDSFESRVVAQSTKIYDRTGKVVLFDVHENVKRTLVSNSEISRHIKNATVAVEDSEFYQHRGVRPKAILRAFIINLTSGDVVQGGSTITQQVVKNSILTRDRSLVRKVKEAVLAVKLESQLNKDDILGLYLNETPYGGNLYGVEEASQAYFGKHAQDVTLAEAAYLAALPKAPTYYSPFGSNRDKLEERKNTVLRRMVELGFATQEEANQAVQMQVTFLPVESRGIKAPHFVMMIKSYLEEKYGREAAERGGFKVITTLDWELHQQAEEVVARYAKENVTKFNASNAALVAVDPKTGQVLSLVGSRDYFDEEIDGNFNVAIAHRQPGSSFKPFVYATALKKGYTPETVVFDLPTQFDTTCLDNPNSCYTPQNYDNKFRGPISLRQALAQSVNVASIKVLYLAGIRDSIQTARDMGITSLTNPNRYGLTLVLGGGEVSLLELTSAYSVFANDGIRNPTQLILKIEDDTGKELESFTTRSQTVLDPQLSRQISDILSDNVARAPAFGENSALNIPRVAAKTGTTNDYRDAWIVGYSPSLTVGVWAGNNDNSPMEKRVAGFIVAPMWNEFFRKAAQSYPIESLPKPSQAPADLKPVLRGWWQGNINYYVDKLSGRLATEYTPEETRQERVVTQVHTILHWVDRGNPTGPAPLEPALDPQYWLWERPVRAWAAERGLQDETESVIPNQKDELHRPELAPQVRVVAPNASLVYNSTNNVRVELSVEGKLPLAQADFFLNGQYLGSSWQAPFTFSFTPSDTPAARVGASNELRVVVYDTQRNRGEGKTELRLE